MIYSVSVALISSVPFVLPFVLLSLSSSRRPLPVPALDHPWVTEQTPALQSESVDFLLANVDFLLVNVDFLWESAVDFLSRETIFLGTLIA